MQERRRQEAIARFEDYCRAVRGSWALQKDAVSQGAFLNGVRQLAEGIVGDLLEVLLEEKPDAVKSPREMRKGPLDGKLNVLRDNGYMDARLHAHFHILRICGNYGSHRQESEMDEELVRTAARSLRICLKWYAQTALGYAFDVDQYLRQAPAYIKIIPESASGMAPDTGTPKRARGRRAKGMLASLGSYLVQLVTLLGGTVALYPLLNRYGEDLLRLFEK